MIHYFQLTPDILLEYVYANDPKITVDGKEGNVKDIHDDSKTILLKSDVFSTKYLCFKNESDGMNSIPNLVLPVNNTETQFVVSKNTKNKDLNFFSKTNVLNKLSSQKGGGYIYEDTNYDADIKKSCDVKYDKCIVHFTSKNYFRSYDSLIFQTYVYMNDKSKLFLASFLFKRTSNLKLKAEHLLYNEKLYTTQIEFDIPSIFDIFGKENKDFNIAISKALGNIEPDSNSDSDSEYQDVGLLKNTPIGINIYGVSGSVVGENNYEKLKTQKINSIYIPYIYNRFDEINVKIYEACDGNSREDGDIDGDFYYIDPEMGSSYSSFVDYIESMGEDIRAYMIMHELCLRESWIDNNGEYQNEITHKEYHIIDINEDDEDYEISERFDAKIKYRPICIRSGKDYVATIIDTIKIINTVDSSSYEVTGSSDIANPYKYGNKLKRLNIKNDSRPIVNVYNKKVSEDKSTASVIGLNKSGGFVVENMTQNITSFIECTNIGVSIVELSPEDII